MRIEDIVKLYGVDVLTIKQYKEWIDEIKKKREQNKT